MTPPAEATARPWDQGRTFSTHKHPSRYWETYVHDSSEHLVATTAGATQEEAEANAALIVRAVNSHETLVKALEEARNCLVERCLPWVCHNGPREGTTHGAIDNTVAVIDAALAAAGGDNG